jgi:hypothetical protein
MLIFFQECYKRNHERFVLGHANFPTIPYDSCYVIQHYADQYVQCNTEIFSEYIKFTQSYLTFTVNFNIVSPISIFFSDIFYNRDLLPEVTSWCHREPDFRSRQQEISSEADTAILWNHEFYYRVHEI